MSLRPKTQQGQIGESKGDPGPPPTPSFALTRAHKTPVPSRPRKTCGGAGSGTRSVPGRNGEDPTTVVSTRDSLRTLHSVIVESPP